MRHVEQVMGTAISIQLADELPTSQLATLVFDTVAWFHEVDRRFSTYKHDSEINRLARGEITIDQCDPDTREVLNACTDLWRRTNGYFDAYATGALDPSGYVKGWSVEVASRRLAEAGSVDHCINAGGDIRCRGEAEPGQPWRIGVRHPWEEDQVVLVIRGTDIAVATSGTYERGAHVLDPIRGKAAEELRSVTVVGPDLALADAYATTAMAMGHAGRDWLATLTSSGYECAVIAADGQAWRSPGLPAD